MSKKLIYQEIKARITSEIPAVKTFRLWNNQVSNDNIENAFNYPAIFLEFADLEYINEQAGLQTIIGAIRLHIVQEEYRTENELNLDFVDQVAKAVNGYQTDTIIKPLIRTSEQQDINHDQLIIWEQDYDFKANDCTSSKYNGGIEIAGGVIDLEAKRDTEITLDIDNDNIRTGDGI